MGFEDYVFGHKDFKINDTLLFNKKNKRNAPDTITITSFNNYSPANRMVEVTVAICYDERIPDVARTSSIIDILYYLKVLLCKTGIFKL